MSKWTGATLAQDLARGKDSDQWMTWVEIPLGAVTWGNCPRADVMAIRKSFSHPTCTIYEVKVSRSDFHADVNKGKYRAYFEDCSQFFFAVPSGLIGLHEVPEGAGLIVRGEKGWHVARAAPRREHTFRVELLLKLLMKGYERQVVIWQQHDRLVDLKYKGLKEEAQEHGIRIARDVASAADLLKEAEELRGRVESVMGRSYGSIDSALMSLRFDVDSLIAQREYAPDAIALFDIAKSLFEGPRHYYDESLADALQAIVDKIRAKTEARQEMPNKLKRKEKATWPK